MLSSMPSVCALLPMVSQIARNSAITAMISAIFWFAVIAFFSPPPCPPPWPSFSCSI